MRGDKSVEIDRLARGLGVTWRFAKKVVSGVRAGTEQELYKRKHRKTAVGMEELDNLEEFLKLPRISRCCPGESVSVGYGQRREKHRLRVSKEAALQEFINTHASRFKVSTLLKHWPQNFVTVSSNDRHRNVCPQHDSYPRLLQGLHSSGVAENVPASCRGASALGQCLQGQDPADPLSWTKECAIGSCSECPELLVELRPGVEPSDMFTFQEWKKAPVPMRNTTGEKREVFTLHNTTMTIEEGIKLLKERTKAMSRHIYTAYNQWEAKRVFERNLQPGTFLQVNDYQNNLTVELEATPTSTAYGGNKINIMVFPIVAYWAEEGKPTQKASIIFVSDDLGHDHQQVKKMEERAVKVCEEKTGLKFFKGGRFTDGCRAQYKSGFVVADQCSAGQRMFGQEYDMIYIYYAGNEGKSESDTTGSNFKVRIDSMILRNPNLVMRCAAELVEVYEKFAPKDTQRYAFLHVEEILPFEREESKARKKVTVPGINKLHQIRYTKGGLKLAELSCLSCLRLPVECETCSKLGFDISPEKVGQMLGRVEDQEEEDEQEVVEYEGVELLEASDCEQEKEDIDGGETDGGEGEREVRPCKLI